MSSKPTVITDLPANRGMTFTLERRCGSGLADRLPSVVEALDEQARHAYMQLRSQSADMACCIFLGQLHNHSGVLYHRLLADHLQEPLPIVYDPTVGDTIKKWSRDYRHFRTACLSIDRPEDIRVFFESLGLGTADVDLLVYPDTEKILGIGDWDVSGTDISIEKLAVYTVIAGIHPARAVAINLDYDTDNQQLLDGPTCLGNRRPRVRGERYDVFIAEYLRVTSELFPQALLHFEDFRSSSACRILERYRGTYRISNDGMQGTGAIVAVAVISGMKMTDTSFTDQQLAVYDAGTVGTGMAN